MDRIDKDVLNDTPKIDISVITVTYNCVDTIERCIKSVINQNHAEYEYIIIDGGSTDGTVEIIEKYREYLSYYVSECDGGIYDAMNKGIKKACGKYIHFLNGDDWYTNDILEVVSDYLNCEIDILYGKVVTVNGGKFSSLSPEPIECIDWKMPMCHQAIFMKNVGQQFDTTYRIAADYKMINEWYNEKRSFQFIPYNIAYYNCGGVSSISVKTKLEITQIAFLAAIKYGKISEPMLNTLTENALDAVNRILFAENENIYQVISFLIEMIKKTDNVIVFGCGKIAETLIPVIEKAGLKITTIVSNNLNDETRRLYSWSVNSPRVLNDVVNSSILVLTESYCDEIVGQIDLMCLDESNDVYTFDELNRNYIRNHCSELIRIANERFGFSLKSIDSE